MSKIYLIFIFIIMPLKINKLINKTFNKYIIDEVVKAFPVYRKHKYSFEYCLHMFKFMLDDVVKWKSLSELSSYEGINEYHYKYLNSVFNKWTSKNIFSKAYSNMLQNEYFRLKHIRNNLIINQIIDCSFITNLYGVNSRATNPEYRKN